MFGEHESESPRVPSPWDSFLPSPPNRGLSPQSSPALDNGIPKLVPEVEEGNIEYKLKLTHISNARFARLVTQLKWRLLEGGGQAYYELGVADSGALIGLSRADLEESLETLEMMAGEIGASVIVVKEIEVPPTIAALADKESGYTDPDTGEWTRKMRRRPLAGQGGGYSGLSSDGGSTSAPTTEVETDFSFGELTDLDDVGSSLSSVLRGAHLSSTSVYTSTTVIGIAAAQRPMRTNPSRPTAQSSPFIAPLDDDLALFSMEPEPAFQDEKDGDGCVSGIIADDELDFGLGSRCSSFAGLEISAVFKPRPVRHRALPRALIAVGVTPGRHGKRWNRSKEKKVQPWHEKGGAEGGEEEWQSKEEKAQQRRVARDKKREEKRNALIAVAQAQNGSGMTEERGADDIAPGHAGAEETSALVCEETSAVAHGVDGADAAVETDGNGCGEGSRAVCTGPVAEEVVEVEREARLIVEALVVRKMSIEEATLDFGRLALG